MPIFRCHYCGYLDNITICINKKPICSDCLSKRTIDIKDTKSIKLELVTKRIRSGAWAIYQYPHLSDKKNIVYKPRHKIRIYLKHFGRYMKNYDNFDFDGQYAKTVTHEYIHYALHKYISADACSKFDNIANNDCFNNEVF